MGSILQKQLLNYRFPLFENQPFKQLHKSQKLSTQFYVKDLMPKEFKLGSMGIISNSILSDVALQQHQYKKVESLTLLTYNVWFEQHNPYNRYPVLLRMLYESKADVICLQEVNEKFLKALKQAAKSMKKQYYMPVLSIQWYDTLILSKYPCKFYRKPFANSTMGRSCLSSIIEFQQQNADETFKLSINCVHLQSQFASVRIQQLQQIGSLNQEMSMSIIAGDFNFTDDSPESQYIEEYIDLWSTGKQHESKQAKSRGFTFPSNPHSKQPLRLDRIIFKCKQKGINQNEIAIIGDFTIPPYEKDHFSKVGEDFIVRTPSDHFGLFSRIYLP